MGNTTLYAIWSKNEATSPKAAENNQTDVQEPEDSAEYPAAELDSEADGVTVHVSAPAGALPEGVQLQTAAVYSGMVTSAIEQSANADGKEVSSLKAIGVTLTDKDGDEIQPNEKVVVTFGNTGVQGEQINVYHMDNEASAPEKIASNVSADPTADDGIVTVDENGTPTAPAEHVDCWAHWLIILGTLLASLYYIGVVIRRQKNINSLRAVAGKGKNV